MIALMATTTGSHVFIQTSWVRGWPAHGGGGPAPGHGPGGEARDAAGRGARADSGPAGVLWPRGHEGLGRPRFHPPRALDAAGVGARDGGQHPALDRGGGPLHPVLPKPGSGVLAPPYIL